MSDFLHGFWGLNSSPHAYEACTLLNQLFMPTVLNAESAATAEVNWNEFSILFLWCIVMIANNFIELRLLCAFTSQTCSTG